MSSDYNFVSPVCKWKWDAPWIKGLLIMTSSMVTVVLVMVYLHMKQRGKCHQVYGNF